jgi:hypothetical protein
MITMLIKIMIKMMMFDDRRSRVMVDADGWLWMMMEMNDDDYSMSMMLK